MFFGKKLLKTLLLLILCISLISTLSIIASADDEAAQKARLVYLEPNANWKTDNAWFALYYFDFNDHYDCVTMTDEDGDGIYEAILPEGYPNFLFYRMNASSAVFDSDFILHQTDCFEYAENTQCYALAEDSWESGDWENAPAAAEAPADGTEETEAIDPMEETAPAETVTEETTPATVPAEAVVETIPEVETQKIYLSLGQAGQDYSWKVATQDAEYDVTEEAEDIYSVELPVGTESITLRGEYEGTQISSAEIDLTDIQDNNCIVALACEEGVDEFDIMWGIYDPETQEVTFAVEENLVIAEEVPEETVATEETENTEETESEDAEIIDDAEIPENTDAVS